MAISRSDMAQELVDAVKAAVVEPRPEEPRHVLWLIRRLAAHKLILSLAELYLGRALGVEDRHFVFHHLLHEADPSALSRVDESLLDQPPVGGGL